PTERVVARSGKAWGERRGARCVLDTPCCAIFAVRGFYARIYHGSRRASHGRPSGGGRRTGDNGQLLVHGEPPTDSGSPTGEPRGTLPPSAKGPRAPAARGLPQCVLSVAVSPAPSPSR